MQVIIKDVHPFINSETRYLVGILFLRSKLFRMEQN